MPELDGTTDVPKLAQSQHAKSGTSQVSRSSPRRAYSSPGDMHASIHRASETKTSEYEHECFEFVRPGLHPHRLRFEHSSVERNTAECSVVCYVGGNWQRASRGKRFRLGFGV